MSNGEPLENHLIASEMLDALAREARELAKRLRHLQEDMGRIDRDAIDGRIVQSAQVLDSAEQGLTDFATIFRSLSDLGTPIRAASVAKALNRCGQHRLRARGLKEEERDRGADDIELF